MLSKTIIYLTDNNLEPWFEKRCQELLLEAANGLPIVSVSQKPIDFGDNYCLGEIGRSGLSIDLQMREALKHIKTDWVSIAEHDCVYSSEHFEFIPSDDDKFWYNDNVWLAQLHNPNHPELDGTYSYWAGRRVQSQLVCRTGRLREATDRKIEIASDPAWKLQYPVNHRIGEPGSANFEKTLRIASYKNVRHLRDKMKQYLTAYGAGDFTTKIPNLDIRHEGNFTGPRRGRKRFFKLEPWGRLKDVLGQ